MKNKSYPIHIYFSAKVVTPLIKFFGALTDVGYFIARLWVANVFFTSAMSKVTDWGATMVLFKYDYSVPLMSPTIAAYLGTGMEFLLPVLLVLGLGGRLSVFIFLIYNIFCVISFHFLWTPPGQTGLYDHINWGLLLMLIMFHGPGRLSIDHLLRKRYGHLFGIGVNTHKFLWFD